MPPPPRRSVAASPRGAAVGRSLAVTAALATGAADRAEAQEVERHVAGDDATFHDRAHGTPHGQHTAAGVPPLVVASVVTGGVAVLALGASAVTGAFALDRSSVVASSCTRGDDGVQRCPPEGLGAAEEGRAFATVSTVTFVGGALAAAACVTLLVVHVSSSRDEPVARVGAWAGPAEGGVRVGGAF